MIHVAEINSLERLSAFRLTWQALWGRTRCATFFQSFDWFENYHRRFGDKHRLRVLIVSLVGKPIGIVPLIVKPVETGMGTMRVLTYPLDSWGAAYGSIGPNPAATMSAAMKHLRDSKRDWDLIDLRYIDNAGCDKGRTLNALRSAGFPAIDRTWDETLVVDTASTWEAYWNSRPKGWRTALNSAETQLAQRGQTSFVRIRPEGMSRGDTDRRWDVFQAFESLVKAERRSQSRYGHACNITDELEFLHELHPAAVDAGQADISLLSVNGRPVAGGYAYHCNGVVETVRVAVAPDIAAEAGTVLIGRMVRDSFERGDAELKFSSAESQFVDGWKTLSAVSRRYTHFSSRTPRAQALRWNQVWRRWTKGEEVAPVSRAVPAVNDTPAPVQLRVVG